jgi:vacuole morphology and inheritance protein 14
MRYAFYAYDDMLQQNLVAKLLKVLSRGYDLDTLKKDLESVFICQHLVNEFNERVIPYVADTSSLLNFVHCFIYELPKSNRYRFYQAENHITGGYEKYNNNAGWATHGVSESAQISQAFSHFSWQLTQGFLMVVDLQGVAGVLTDPQIHCLDNKRFVSGNLGYEGILKFFFSHKCNKYCTELGLKHPTNVQANNSVQEENFYNPKRAWDRLLSRSQNINTLCDLCR